MLLLVFSPLTSQPALFWSPVDQCQKFLLQRRLKLRQHSCYLPGLDTTWTDIFTVGGIDICPPLRLKPSRMLEMGALQWNCPSPPVQRHKTAWQRLPVQSQSCLDESSAKVSHPQGHFYI